MPALDLCAGSSALDLGCGPGLYATRLVRHRIEVLGIDVSRRSLLTHAHQVAEQESLPIRLRQGSYLDLDLGNDHDAAILIYEDYCALSPEQRALLLSRVHDALQPGGDALRPGGRFVFDVTSVARFPSIVEGRREAVNLMDGFWADEPYTGVHETWMYPELHLVLDRYTIRTADRSRQFWNWMHFLTVDEVAAELASAGFASPELYGDVAGESYDERLQLSAANRRSTVMSLAGCVVSLLRYSARTGRTLQLRVEARWSSLTNSANTWSNSPGSKCTS